MKILLALGILANLGFSLDFLNILCSFVFLSTLHGAELLSFEGHSALILFSEEISTTELALFLVATLIRLGSTRSTHLFLWG